MTDYSDEKKGFFSGLRRKLIGAPRDIEDKSIFHKISLIPVLAWIGLGADGLSSSAYGPEEAFRALGEHTYLALFLALATALTVFIISYAYSRIIEHFPSGGGGYVVATHTLGEKAGVVSGSALIVDYMLTITVSIASCGDALFSFLPVEWHYLKLSFEAFLILALIVLNLRGVRESVMILAPIFMIFILTHLFMLGYGVLTHVEQAETLAHEFRGDLSQGLTVLGGAGMLLLSFTPIRWEAGRSPGSKRSRTGSRSCGSRKSTRGRGPCSTCPPPWLSPPAGSWSAISC